MKAPKIFFQTARLEHEVKIIRAFEDIANAIATQNPGLDRAECRRSAQFVLEDTARQIREGKLTVASQPYKPSRAFDVDEFVRSLTEGTGTPHHPDDSL